MRRRYWYTTIMAHHVGSEACSDLYHATMPEVGTPLESSALMPCIWKARIIKTRSHWLIPRVVKAGAHAIVYVVMAVPSQRRVLL